MSNFRIYDDGKEYFGAIDFGSGIDNTVITIYSKDKEGNTKIEFTRHVKETDEDYELIKEMSLGKQVDISMRSKKNIIRSRIHDKDLCEQPKVEGFDLLKLNNEYKCTKKGTTPDNRQIIQVKFPTDNSKD